MEQLTDIQATVVSALADYVEGATVRQLADHMQRPGSGLPRYGDSRVRAALEGARRKGVVEKRQSWRNQRRATLYNVVPGA